MTQSVAAARDLSAPELEMLLVSARRGAPARHGEQVAQRVTTTTMWAVGGLAGAIWGLDLFLALGHSL